MGTQTMGLGSQGSYGGAGRGTQESTYDTLARQNSMYNLTLDEVQSQLGDLGKPLSSMNLDELLKSVLTVEANQGLGRANYGATQNEQLASSSTLNRQSSVTLSRDLTKKTVDEVWQDIQQGKKTTSTGINSRERNSTLGEMTLEDFLVKAGVVAEGVKASVPVKGVTLMALPHHGVSQHATWMDYQIPSAHPTTPQKTLLTNFMQGNPVQPPLSMSSNPILSAYSETQMAISPSALLDTQTPGRKRIASGDVVEKIVERRQKRMIKNRESAARSRARKQAYTTELENKVSRLEEENERLKRQKEAETLLPFVPLLEPKYQLRRISSASF